MPDLLIRGIDNPMAERIKALARERNWSINDVILNLLKHALGMTEDDLSVARPHQDIAVMAGTWDSSEAAAFREALAALESIPANDTPLTVKSHEE